MILCRNSMTISSAFLTTCSWSKESSRAIFITSTEPYLAVRNTHETCTGNSFYNGLDEVSRNSMYEILFFVSIHHTEISLHVYLAWTNLFPVFQLLCLATTRIFPVLFIVWKHLSRGFFLVRLSPLILCWAHTSIPLLNSYTFLCCKARESNLSFMAQQYERILKNHSRMTDVSYISLYQSDRKKHAYIFIIIPSLLIV